jgi:uncharacterized membrane protein YfcA
MVGNQGGIRAAALLGFNLSARQLVATSTASAILVDAARLPIYLLTAGSAIVAAKATVVVATIGVVVGTMVGVPALGRIPASIYRRMLGGLLMILGAWLLVTALRSVTS